ncbi:hypothetical protein F383_37528 [Gossypium arboreum]|uniref:DC1 domain-containing protein n=1 Tax=Gossypium arboreum TaxID=29729 RepID=A0A0B0MCV8_GOSAR|nr:hypothetical protein F383_37528 [Gossypium arboreum]
MEIQHVIHDHPLSLSFIEEGSTKARCKGCKRDVSGPTYGCKFCWYFIHKSCLDEHKAELSCRFRADLECALNPMVEYSDEECTTQHFTHAHPLKLIDSN